MSAGSATPFESANLAVRVLLELAALVALGYWGVTAGDTPTARLALGLGAPLLAAAGWAVFGAPGAPRALSGPSRLVLELVVFGAATLALYDAGQPALAAAFAVLAVANRALLYARDQ
jgi:hypothetical protein